MRNVCLLGVVGWSVGCSVEVASLAIVSPAPGSSHTRDQLATSGALVASVGVEVDVGGDVEVARVAITSGDVAFGDVADNMLAAQLAGLGAVTLTATAYAA